MKRIMIVGAGASGMSAADLELVAMKASEMAGEEIQLVTMERSIEELRERADQIQRHVINNVIVEPLKLAIDRMPRQERVKDWEQRERKRRRR